MYCSTSSQRTFMKFSVLLPLRRHVQSVLFFLLCGLFTLYAQTPQKSLTQEDWAKVHTLSIASVNAMYNLQFTEAEQRANEVIGIAPRDPRGHFFKSSLYYYRNVIYKNKQDYDKFMYYSQRTIQVCEEILKTNEKDSKALFYLGGTLGYRGMLYAGQQELMKAVWEGKKGYNRLKEAVEVDPNNADAQMGLGMFNYMISQAPAIIRPALKLAGLSGDRLTGLRQLENAMRNGIYAKTEAQWMLANFLRGDLEAQPDKAGALLQNLIQNYPNNDFFVSNYANLLLFNLRQADKAIPLYQKIIQRGNQANTVATGDAMQRLGVAYLYKNSFPEAQQWFQRCIAHNADSIQVRNANYNLGWTFELQGNRSAAIPHYQKSTGVQRSVDLLKTPATPHDIIVDKQGLLFNAGDYGKAWSMGEEILQYKALSDEHTARALYTQGRSAFEQGDYARAEERFARALALNVATAAWLLPNTRYRLGLTQMKLGKRSEARQSLEQALGYKNYNNEDFMKRLIQKELARLKNS